MSVGDKIYPRLPVLLQHTAVSTFGFYWKWLRFGHGYKPFLREYREREHFTASDWKAYQNEQLKRILHYAANEVPYYRDTWTKEQKDAAHDGNLAALPLLSKDPIRSRPELFLRDDMRHKKQLIFFTSGSTGTPISCIGSVADIRNTRALREARSLNWAGVSFKMPRATFSGRMVEPNPASKGPFYRYNIAERQVYFSAFHLRPDTAAIYLKALKRHKIQWMTGYAVSYYLLAKFIKEKNLPVPPLKAIITTSEKITSEMRSLMEESYQCRVFEEYSTVETALFASECPHGRLHLSPDVAIVELIREDGILCEPGEVGEVVVTCLIRELQQLVRFRLGDMAVWDDQTCPCGRGMPVLKEIVGRIEDVIIGQDGRRLVRFHGIFTDQPHVREGQIVQETLDRIRVKVVTTEDFGTSDVQEITYRMHQRVGKRIEIIVEPVEQIPRTARGKFKAVLSLLQNQGVVEAESTGVEFHGN